MSFIKKSFDTRRSQISENVDLFCGSPDQHRVMRFFKCSFKARFDVNFGLSFTNTTCCLLHSL